jgi:hypothetical protein
MTGGIHDIGIEDERHHHRQYEYWLVPCHRQDWRNYVQLHLHLHHHHHGRFGMVVGLPLRTMMSPGLAGAFAFGAEGSQKRSLSSYSPVRDLCPPLPPPPPPSSSSCRHPPLHPHLRQDEEEEEEEEEEHYDVRQLD